MEEDKFKKIIEKAVEGLPDEFRNALDNIDIVVEDWPTREQIEHFEKREGLNKSKGSFLLLGLYQGIPKEKRGPSFYQGVLPDKITLFSRSIEELCGGNERTTEEQIKRTLLHEIGHYFGLSDKKLRELGY